MTNNLKPCPFCGVQPETKEWIVGDIPQIKIWCDEGGCHVHPSVFGNKETMTKIWNTRSSDQGWQPIETAPIDGCLWVLIGHQDYAVPEIGYFNKRYNVWCSGSDRTLFLPHGPTHWMPLPAPPEQEK